MKNAWITAAVGTVLSFWVSSHFLGFTTLQCLEAVLVSNFAGFVGLLLTLWLERQPIMRRVFMNHWFRVWGVLAVFYFGILLAWIPALRGPKEVALMFVPLVMGNGWMLPLFGVAQDAIISREQRRAKA